MEKWKINLTILWMTQILSLMSFGFGLPFIPFYIKDLGIIDPEQIKLYTGILSAAPAITMAVMAPIWGILSDKYGRKLMILRAMFTAIFIIGGMGFVTNVFQLVVLRALQGIFTGTVTASSAFVASNTPNEKLSSSLGFLASSTFIGYSFGPILGGVMAELFGYRVGFIAGGVLMAIAFVLVLVFVKEEKMDFVEKNGPSFKKSRSKDVFSGYIMIMLMVLFIQRITRSIFAPFLPLYIEELVVSRESINTITGVSNGVNGLATAISGIMIGRMADHMNKEKLIKGLMIIGFIASTLLLFKGDHRIFIVTYGLFFLIIGGIEPLVTSITAEKTDAGKRGRLFGVQGLVGSIGWMISPVIGTYVSIQWGTYFILFSIVVFMIINVITYHYFIRKIMKEEQIYE